MVYFIALGQCTLDIKHICKNADTLTERKREIAIIHFIVLALSFKMETFG